jgi:hypothetical protein
VSSNHLQSVDAVCKTAVIVLLNTSVREVAELKQCA